MMIDNPLLKRLCEQLELHELPVQHVLRGKLVGVNAIFAWQDSPTSLEIAVGTHTGSQFVIYREDPETTAAHARFLAAIEMRYLEQNLYRIRGTGLFDEIAGIVNDSPCHLVLRWVEVWGFSARRLSCFVFGRGRVEVVIVSDPRGPLEVEIRIHCGDGITKAPPVNLGIDLPYVETNGHEIEFWHATLRGLAEWIRDHWFVIERAVIGAFGADVFVEPTGVNLPSASAWISEFEQTFPSISRESIEFSASNERATLQTWSDKDGAWHFAFDDGHFTSFSAYAKTPDTLAALSDYTRELHEYLVRCPLPTPEEELVAGTRHILEAPPIHARLCWASRFTLGEDERVVYRCDDLRITIARRTPYTADLSATIEVLGEGEVPLASLVIPEPLSEPPRISELGNAPKELAHRLVASWLQILEFAQRARNRSR